MQFTRKRLSPVSIFLFLAAAACISILFFQRSPKGSSGHMLLTVDKDPASTTSTQNSKQSAVSAQYATGLNNVELQPSGFALIPSAMERPLKPKAVITLLISTDKEQTSMDFYSMSAILQSFLFIHYPATKFSESEANETDFAVMVTPMIAPHVRDALLDVGARLIVVPTLVLKDWDPIYAKFQYVMTKLRVFQLEGVYSSILFVDADIFFLKRNPASDLWKYLEAHEANPATRGTTFFGASPDPCQPTINTGLFLFKPSIYDFKEMTRLATTPPYNKYVDQTAMHYYFQNATGMTIFPEEYNVIAFDICQKNIDVNRLINSTLGYHVKFWENRSRHKELFYLWQRPMAALRMWQMARGTKITLSPVVPEAFKDWATICRSGAMMYRAAIFSLEIGRGKEIELRQRDKLAGSYAQAVHLRRSDIPDVSRLSTIPLLEALRFVVTLAEYDWVLILDHRAVAMKSALVHSHLGEVAKATATLGVYRDCGGARTAGFWIGRKALPHMHQLVADLDRMWYDQQVGAYAPELTDDVVWEFVTQAFAKSMALVDGRYAFHRVEKGVCKHLLKLRGDETNPK
ncbi:hypothetical protein BC830DRAFT_1118294 [Chytriomyces sp. MP71]|nr:hypothetical protein BC830DRAFT_1118294 [Chytriomyces sp. MP71]